MEKQKLVVMKFGGTSVGSIEAVRNVLEIVRDAKLEWQDVVVVNSALSGVTNALIASARGAASGNEAIVNETWQMLLRRHREMLDYFVADPDSRSLAWLSIHELIEEFVNLCHAILILGELTDRALDAVCSLGERMATRVLAAALNAAGIPAEVIDANRVIQTNANFQSAIPDLQRTKQKVEEVLFPCFNAEVVPVVTGFIGATEEGFITTLGRGGSDYSAALLGVALEVDAVWIWTDVDGVMTADPRLVPEARTIASLSFREVSELAYFGAKVLHPKTIRPVIDAGIALRVLNTLNPKHPGTRITVDQELGGAGGILKAVTAIREIQMITVEGRGMLGVPGVAARIFGAVATTGATVPFITEASSEQSITLAVPMEFTGAVIEAIENEMAQELKNRNIDRVSATEEVVIVTAVSPRMQQRMGVAGQVFSALAAAGVNVLAISHGSSDVSTSLVVQAEDLPRTMLALHALTESGEKSA